MGMVSLDSAVKSLINELDGSIHHYGRLYKIGIDVLRDFNLDVNGTIKTIVLPVSSIKTVEFPQEMIDYIRIGVINDNGEIATLTKNTALSKSFDDISTRLEHLEGSKYSGAYRNFNGGGHSLALGASMPSIVGTFTIDNTKRIIALSPDFEHTEIVLEFLCNGYAEDEYQVDERVVKAVQADIYLRSIEKKSNVPQSEKRTARRNLSTEKTNARMRLKPLRISEINDSLRKGNKYGLKG